MWTLVDLIGVYCGVGLEAMWIFLLVQASLIVIVPPIWVAVYRAIRRHHRTTPYMPLGIAWVQGILAWGIVAVAALFQRRRIRVPGIRLLVLLNVTTVTLIGALLRPDLEVALWLGVGLWLLAIYTLPRGGTAATLPAFIPRRQPRRMRSH
jgi:hypothetical protein